MQRTAVLTIALAGLASSGALADEVTVTDVTGREVVIDVPVSAAILGEGRLLYGVAPLERENPFERIVGWPEDLKTADPATWAAYEEKFPDASEVATVGEMKRGEFSAEQAIDLNADVVIMNHEAMQAAEDAGLEAKLSAAGIPLVYADFRDEPMQNTEPTLSLLGTLFGEEERAQDFIDFRAKQIARVTDVIESEDPERPVAFVERAAGASDDCCWSYGNENFGTMVELAGGQNLAKEIIPGTFGTVNPEQVVASNPAHIIVTSTDWSAFWPDRNWVPLGPGADMDLSRSKLEGLTDRPAYAGSGAVANDRVHAVWHQFYNSPYQFVAIQQMAKWMHPELFSDLDPEATLQELHERFLPVDYNPGYFVSLSSDVSN